MVLENYASLLAIITTISGSIMSMFYFLQVYKIQRRKSVEDLSLGMFAVMFIGTLLWLLYGLSLDSYSIIISNIIGLVGIGGVIALYFKYKK